MKKGRKAKKHTATKLVRVSAAMLARLRAESLRSGIPLRELGDRALRAYLDPFRDMPGLREDETKPAAERN